MVGLCLGAFGLAEAGLLDGRRATTHWARAGTFAARYPRVAVDPGALFRGRGAGADSAGIAAGLDCCLHLLARLSWTGEANRIARHLVVAPLRAGAQLQLTARPALGSPVDRRVSEVLEAVRVDPCGPLPGRPRPACGPEPPQPHPSYPRPDRGSLGDWLKRARLARAQDLLAGGARGLEDVALRSGFPDAHALRAAFGRNSASRRRNGSPGNGSPRDPGGALGDLGEPAGIPFGGGCPSWTGTAARGPPECVMVRTLTTAIAALATVAALAGPAQAQSVQAPATGSATATPDNAILLTVFLRHDQSRPLSELNQQLALQGFYKAFPPAGMEVVSWTVAMESAR